MFVRIDLILEVIDDSSRRPTVNPLKAMCRARERLTQHVHDTVDSILKDGLGNDSKIKIIMMATCSMKDK